MALPEVVADTYHATQFEIGIGAPQRRWPISYDSIGAAVCALDVILILLASVGTGVLYEQTFYAAGAGLYRHVVTALVVNAVLIPLLWDRGLYEPTALVNWYLQTRKIVALWVVTFLGLAGAVFALKIGKDFSRGAVLSFCVVGLVLMLGHRAFWRIAIQSGLEKGALRGRKSILLCLHEGPTVTRVTHAVMRELARHGYEIQHTFKLETGTTRKELIERAITHVRGSDAEELILSADLQRWTEIKDLVQELCVLPLPLTLLPDESTATLFRRPSHQFGSWVGVEFQRAPLTGAERLLKRGLDIGCSLVAITMLAPMFLIIALAIKLDSPGPAFFAQTRHGFNRKRFKILKFRTMSVLEDGATVAQAVRDDKRVTRLGMWLRKTSIDELPQLFNVLKGEMSICGPRPHAVAHDSYYAELISKYAFRHHMKPGITGWAQVHGYRGETPTVDVMKQRVDLDLWYVDNWSLLLDLQIIVRTATEVLRGRNAY